jgi:carboxylesterase
LPRHGHADPLSTALERLRADDLYAAVTEYIAVAEELGDRVTIAGFSLGGLLAAWIGQHHAVERCVPISPFFGVSLIPNRFMGAIAERLLRVPNRFYWWNPILRERHTSTNGYPRYATHAIAHSYRIARSLLDEARTTRPLAEHLTIVTNAAEVAVNNYAIRSVRVPSNSRGSPVCRYRTTSSRPCGPGGSPIAFTRISSTQSTQLCRPNPSPFDFARYARCAQGDNIGSALAQDCASLS